MSTSSLIETLNRSSQPTATYSDISVVGIPPDNPYLYQLQTAGQVGVPPLTHPNQEIPISFKEQAENPFANVASCLALKGATPQDITKITIYIVDYSTHLRDELIDVITTFFTVPGQEARHAPPSSLIGVAKLALPQFLVEVEATAVCKARSR